MFVAASFVNELFGVFAQVFGAIAYGVIDGFSGPLGRALALAVCILRRMQASVSPAPARDRALDVLRGWAIVKMLVSHVGPLTRVAAALNVTLFVSAAEAFVLVSGLVQGIRARRRDTDSGARAFYAGAVRRAWLLLRIHYVLTAIVVVVHELTGRLDTPGVAELGGWLRTLWLLLSLQLQPTEYMNILPLYVVFLLLSPVVIETMRRGGTWLVLVVCIGLWAVAQRYPAVVPFASEESGDIVFSLAAWQLVYNAGLVLGYHRYGIIQEFWRYGQRWMMPVTFAVTVALVAVAQLDRSGASALGLGLPQTWDWLVSKQTWGLARAVYTFALLFSIYLLVRMFFAANWGVSGWRGSLTAWLTRLLQMLEAFGRNGLRCFLLHLLLALAASAVLVSSWPWVAQEVVVVAALWALYELMRRNVGAKLLPR